MMQKTTQSGFTLFVAVLLGGLMLAIGFAIFNLAFKELQLSSSARESQRAFYAADTGLECALFFDQKENSFNISSPASGIGPCGGQGSIPVSSSVAAGVYTRDFTITFPDGSHVAVTVTKRTVAPVQTLIEARGFNLQFAGDVRRTERGLRVRYSGI